MHIKALKLSGIVSLFSLSLHYCAHGYIAGERAVLARFQHLKHGIVSGLAQDLGYVPSHVYTDSDITEFIDAESRTSGINPTVIHAMIRRESGGNQYAKSRAGALGLMQVMPFHAVKTCKLKHYSELYDDEKNVRCAIKIFRAALTSQRWDLRKSLMEYNGGARCVNKCTESINYANTVINTIVTQTKCAVTNKDRKQLDNLLKEL